MVVATFVVVVAASEEAVVFVDVAAMVATVAAVDSAVGMEVIVEVTLEAEAVLATSPMALLPKALHLDLVVVVLEAATAAVAAEVTVVAVVGMEVVVNKALCRI